MVDVLLFHHALGLTPGVIAFADVLRGAGYRVHVPDLYEGRTFDALDAGLRYAQRVGLGAIVERGMRAAEALPDALIYAGFSLGVLPAQTLAQKRRGARGALLFSACVPTGQIGGAWPPGVPVQVHGMAGDTIFVGEGDLEAARGLVSECRRRRAVPLRGSGPPVRRRRHGVGTTPGPPGCSPIASSISSSG